MSAINRSVVAGPQGGVSQAEPRPAPLEREQEPRVGGGGRGAGLWWPRSRTEVAEELEADGPARSARKAGPGAW